MARQILRRCDVCQRYHVSYVVEDEHLGKRYLCATCWKALYGEPTRAGTKEEKSEPSRPPKKNGQA